MTLAYYSEMNLIRNQDQIRRISKIAVGLSVPGSYVQVFDNACTCILSIDSAR